MNDIEKSIIEAVNIIVEQKTKNLNYNYYIEGMITSVNVDGTYSVAYLDQTLEAVKARDGLSLLVNDVVYVCVVNNKFSNKSYKFIDLKRP